ncbi:MULTISPECIES: accessory Sec system glycosyltransferase GtfA [unclassified Granulicatella]|uniref:accessory Sec system glycosyltransferase GtfA n=1 Tax=unclassified Granulicatella TaxID=2630493 RepID=UPI0010737028|nr:MULTISPECIES: accessory Sec system glycosyltransferase GtfA [unclassified Granulicatella]MBF0780168.1 accessory Sec system glycosyltransferase GtfA [Granulicatella sp. 19428wC4_WM01]TFU95721.1 accessory Sec system glycosyltransferase GtfA [Granulicatella sp. WM01]
MTIYNINLGIGWASSGVEYAQVYRAGVFRQLKQPAKFIFTDMIRENIQHLTQNIGFLDEEVIWLYTYFTDINIAPTTYTLDDFLKTIPYTQEPRIERTEQIVRYIYSDHNVFFTAYLAPNSTTKVERVEYVVNGILVRKDYFSYTKIYSEYYAPKNNEACLYQRRFFNEDGSVAYEEIIDGAQSIYRMNEKTILYSKEEFMVYFMKQLCLTKEDIVILDRSTGTGQAVFQYCKPARLGIVVHAEHFSANSVTQDTILWNNYYDYQFTNADKVDFFITATKAQKDLLVQQFEKYTPFIPAIYEVPVGSLDTLKGMDTPRKPYALVTASRLASEKHIDWLIHAVANAKKSIPELTFDIYGEGGQSDALRQLITEYNAQDYIQLKGHQDLSDVYQQYTTYVSASTSEGFGLTLLEAVGSGLSMIGFNVRYGNQTFIQNGENGYLIDKTDDMDWHDIVTQLSEKIVQLLTKHNLEYAQKVSYRIAEHYLTSETEQKWLRVLKGEKA